MELVMVERNFREPVTFEEIQAIEDAGSWCLEAHDVTFLKTFFSKDRRRMLCLYRAPDAEAVRRAERQARVPFDLAWACAWVEGPPHPGAAAIEPLAREHVVVERKLDRPYGTEEVQAMISGGRWCFDTHNTLYLGGYLSRDGQRMACVFRGPDAESVRRANRQLEYPHSAVWTSTLHEPAS